MFRAKLTKIGFEGPEERTKLRTQSMEGKSGKLPTVGESFQIFGVALDPTQGDARVISTSMVQQVMKIDKENRQIVFKTLNSTYQLDLLSDKTWEDYAGHAAYGDDTYK